MIVKWIWGKCIDRKFHFFPTYMYILMHAFRINAFVQLVLGTNLPLSPSLIHTHTHTH